MSKLTEQLKASIDSMGYEQLLTRWRFAKIGDPIMQDESGVYWGKRMAVLRDKHPNPAQVSKDVGWG